MARTNHKLPVYASTECSNATAIQYKPQHIAPMSQAVVSIVITILECLCLNMGLFVPPIKRHEFCLCLHIHCTPLDNMSES